MDYNAAAHFRNPLYYRYWTKAGLGHGVPFWQAGSFAAGWMCLAAALISPLHGWGELVFSAHMIEHELLVTIAVPLLVLARPAGGSSLGVAAIDPGCRRVNGSALC